jgi:hypothetical protein
LLFDNNSFVKFILTHFYFFFIREKKKKKKQYSFDNNHYIIYHHHSHLLFLIKVKIDFFSLFLISILYNIDFHLYCIMCVSLKVSRPITFFGIWRSLFGKYIKYLFLYFNFSCVIYLHLPSVTSHQSNLKIPPKHSMYISYIYYIYIKGNSSYYF